MHIESEQMDIITLTLYVADFFAPAIAMGLAVSFVNLNASKGRSELGKWTRFFVNTLVGCFVLMAGLVLFGEDGKMSTYAALVLCVGASQWVLTRGWRSRI